MYLCYIDESGTPEVTGNTSHFVLAGLSLPIERWNVCDKTIETIKNRHNLSGTEIHVAWILRRYPEQGKIPNFEQLNIVQRRSQVQQFRTAELLRLQTIKNPKLFHQTKKNYSQTEPYIHLTEKERNQFILDVATNVSQWQFARLFAECIDKIHFDPTRGKQTIAEQSFEQVVTRFEHYLQIRSSVEQKTLYGMLIHDNNETVAKKHTELMKQFHQNGTMWLTVKNIIETPLFVDSQLTSMVQIADLCAYAIRKYLEKDDTELFNLIFQRADRKENTVVGVRHFSKWNCPCIICTSTK